MLLQAFLQALYLFPYLSNMPKSNLDDDISETRGKLADRGFKHFLKRLRKRDSRSIFNALTELLPR